MKQKEKQNQTLCGMIEKTLLSLEQQQKIKGGTSEGGQVTNNSADADAD